MFNQEGLETPAVPTEGTQNPSATTNTSPFDNLLSEIRNERGEPKYRSVEDGLKALQHSQDHIHNITSKNSQLEAEVAELRKRTADIDELKDTIKKLTLREAPADTQPSAITDEQLAEIVDKRLSAKHQETVVKSNKQSVVDAMTKKFGDKAGEVFYAKAKELEISPEEFEALSAKSPKVVLTMLGLNGDAAPKQAFKSHPQGTLNTEHFQGKRDSFINAETERVPLGGGSEHFDRILENSRNMVEELRANGMSVEDLTNPVNFMRIMRNKGK